MYSLCGLSHPLLSLLVSPSLFPPSPFLSLSTCLSPLSPSLVSLHPPPPTPHPPSHFHSGLVFVHVSSIQCDKVLRQFQSLCLSVSLSSAGCSSGISFLYCQPGVIITLCFRVSVFLPVSLSVPLSLSLPLSFSLSLSSSLSLPLSLSLSLSLPPSLTHLTSLCTRCFQPHMCI